jgi:hypothetical protein
MAEMVERVALEHELLSVLLEVDEPHRSTILRFFMQERSACLDSSRRAAIAGVDKGLEVLRSGLDKRFGGNRRGWTLGLVSIADSDDSSIVRPSENR